MASETTTTDRAPRFAKCPCGSSRIHRQAGPEHAGPMDMCMDCASTWPAKPGTITMGQHRVKNMPMRKVELKTKRAKKLFGED
jgi:hypothetical protein